MREERNPMPIEKEAETKLLLKILNNAGEIGMSYWRKNLSATVKESHHSIVTEADLSIEAFLIKELKRHFPDHDILSEESPKTVSEPFFVVDPLDGTSFFHRGLSDWTITFARVDKDIEFGATYSPVLGELYHARSGYGAYLNDKPIRVSSTSSINEALVNVGHGVLRSDESGKIKILLRDIRTNWTTGSTAFTFANLAAGRIDAVIQKNQAFWDIAAGIVLVREAGGIVTTWNNKSIFDHSGATVNNVLGTNGQLHKYHLESLQA